MTLIFMITYDFICDYHHLCYLCSFDFKFFERR